MTALGWFISGVAALALVQFVALLVRIAHLHFIAMDEINKRDALRRAQAPSYWRDAPGWMEEQPENPMLKSHLYKSPVETRRWPS